MSNTSSVARRRTASGPRSGKPRVKKKRRPVPPDQEAAQIAANSYSLCTYGGLCMGGVPHRLTIREQDVWIVPVVLTSPGFGIVGEIGMLVVDAKTHEVLGATPRDVVRAAADVLAWEKRKELHAAFLRAKKA